MSDYAYCRVSSIDQNEDRQLDAMAALGIPPERVYLEKQSGKNAKRPQLQMLMEVVQRGDSRPQSLDLLPFPISALHCTALPPATSRFEA